MMNKHSFDAILEIDETDVDDGSAPLTDTWRPVGALAAVLLARMMGEADGDAQAAPVAWAAE